MRVLLLLAILATALPAQDLSGDPAVLLVTSDGVMDRAGRTWTGEQAVLAAGAVRGKPALVLAQDPGAPWYRDVAVRDALVGTGAFRRVAFERAAPRAVTAGEVTSRLDALGSESWEEREAATVELFRLGLGAVGELARAAEAAGDLEVRWRLAYVAEELDRWREGYLGIAHAYVESGRASGMQVERVYAATAAWRCGLRVGDVVEEVDGKSLRSGRGLETSAGMFRGLRSGRAIRLSVRRGEERIEIDAEMGPAR